MMQHEHQVMNVTHWSTNVCIVLSVQRDINVMTQNKDSTNYHTCTVTHLVILLPADDVRESLFTRWKDDCIWNLSEMTVACIG